MIFLTLKASKIINLNSILMKNIAIIILSFAIVSCSQQGEKTGDKATREVKQYTIGQFYKSLSIYGGSFSADETKLLVTSVKLIVN